MSATRPDVLVVDDQPSIRSLTSRWLEHSGYRVLAVSTADQALDAMDGSGAGIAVVDVHLVGHDGVWLARQLRERTPDAALIFVSGDPSAAPTLARAGLGVFDYLEKPFTAAQFMEAVDRGASWHEDRLVARRQQAEPVTGAAPQWSYDEQDGTWVQRADWLPSPTAVSRIVVDLRLNR